MRGFLLSPRRRSEREKDRRPCAADPLCVNKFTQSDTPRHVESMPGICASSTGTEWPPAAPF